MEICISIIPEFSNARREGSLQTLNRAAFLSGWLSSTNYSLWPELESLGRAQWRKGMGERGVDGKAVVMVKYK